MDLEAVLEGQHGPSNFVQSDAILRALRAARYWLRWRFEYVDGRPPIRGVWNRSGKGCEAWRIKKEGLLYAVVEAEDRFTYEQKDLLRVRGDQYIAAQWEAVSGTGAVIDTSSGALGLGSMKLAGFSYGLSFITTQGKVSVLIDGSVYVPPQAGYYRFREHSNGGVQ